MSYQATYDLTVDVSMRQRTQVACVLVAQDIANEDPVTPDHSNRLRWAKYTMAWPIAVMENAIWYVCINPTILAAGINCADDDIKFVIVSILPILISMTPA
jgi:hypothetical protein